MAKIIPYAPKWKKLEWVSFLLLDIIKVEEQLAGILQREFKK